MGVREKLEEELTGMYFDFDPQEIKNLDLLYRYLNEIQNFLFLKKEQAEQAGDEKMLAYIDGQISGYKVALATIHAFFDN